MSDAPKQVSLEAPDREDTIKIPNQNTSMAYYLMTNTKGRQVPVAPHNLKDCLERGYKHTDGELKRDDPTKHHAFNREQQKRGTALLNDTLEKLALNQEQMTKVLAFIAQVASGVQPKQPESQEKEPQEAPSKGKKGGKTKTESKSEPVKDESQKGNDVAA